MASFNGLAWGGVSVLMLALLAPLSNRAQTNGGGISNEAHNPMREVLERRSREIALRSIAMMGAEKRDPREQRVLFEQMSDDFMQIQVIRLAMVKNISDGKRFDYKRLAEDAGQIRRRAARLRVGLALKMDTSEDIDLPPVEYQAQGIQDAASDLCLEISRFTTNPLFDENSVYNLRYANEADKSLVTIINLSENIKNSANSLRRRSNEH